MCASAQGCESGGQISFHSPSSAIRTRNLFAPNEAVCQIDVHSDVAFITKKPILELVVSRKHQIERNEQTPDKWKQPQCYDNLVHDSLHQSPLSVGIHLSDD